MMMMEGRVTAAPAAPAEESVSNLTSGASGGSPSGNRDPPPKKKRNLPGNPDPDAEVVALSPRTLMATNRFVCEICGKGFQRDQNLQLHRRGHNLPWKLKQRSGKEAARKKVYVCPESACVHHLPSRALGDLTGIKKHFCRKHGEKKWKCDKCAKRYAVHSDWKAHSKTCGTREYRCDCGTLFSRRDSFITHRAFCDALAEETARAAPSAARLKNEPALPELPPWLSSPTADRDFDYEPPGRSFFPYHHFPAVSSPGHMSATALLQKAAQIGAAPPATGSASMAGLHRGHASFSEDGNCTSAVPCSGGFALNCDSSSRDPEIRPSDGHFGSGVDQKPPITDGGGLPPPQSSALLMEMMTSLSSAGCFAGPSFRDLLEGGGNGGGGDGMTRDFLGLRPLSHSEILNIASLSNCINTPQDHQDPNQKPW